MQNLNFSKLLCIFILPLKDRSFLKRDKRSRKRKVQGTQMTASSSMLSLDTHSFEGRNNFVSTHVTKDFFFYVLGISYDTACCSQKIRSFHLFLKFVLDKTNRNPINKENKSMEDQNPFSERQT